jgi:hypothetical protein
LLSTTNDVNSQEQADGSSTVAAAVSYLQAQTSTASPFATVLSTYALALACESTGTLGCDGLASTLDALEAAAVTEGGLSHWQTGESAAPVSPYGERCEIPSYPCGVALAQSAQSGDQRLTLELRGGVRTGD